MSTQDPLNECLSVSHLLVIKDTLEWTDELYQEQTYESLFLRIPGSRAGPAWICLYVDDRILIGWNRLDEFLMKLHREYEIKDR